MKSRQNVILLFDGIIFSPIFKKYWQVSKYTAMLSEFNFPKKGKIIKAKFWMVNLHKHYIQILSKDHRCKTANAKSTKANSHTIVTV